MAKGKVLDFGGDVITLLLIADIDITYQKLFIVYATYVLNSGGIM
jgi:hypothetical protein